GYGLLGALAAHGLGFMNPDDKDNMRELALRGGPYSEEERECLLNYCTEDVNALARLLGVMVQTVDIKRALIRGRYMAAAARIEAQGVPIDTEALAGLRSNWIAIQDRLIESIDAGRGIYEGRGFRSERFRAWLIAQDIPWPHLESGSLDLSDDTFREM